MINKKYKDIFQEAINDDLNTAKALATTWDLIKDVDVSPADKHATLIDFDRVFGLGLSDIEELEIPTDVQTLLDEREIARQEKDWNASDELREEIKSFGFDVKDSTDGQVVSKN